MIAALVHSGAEGDTPDNLDTLVQLKEIGRVLESLGFVVHSVCFESSLGDVEKALCELQPDFVFNLVETIQGKDSLQYVAASAFEFLQIPYTGCSAVALATLASKLQQKKMMHLAGLPVPDDRTAVADRWIIKSDSEHASKGIDAESVVSRLDLAKNKIREKEKAFGGTWFAEPFIEGREFNISLLQNLSDKSPQVLRPAEILFKDYSADQPKIVDYAAKWDDQSKAYHSTPRSFEFGEADSLLLKQLRTLSLKCWDLFQLAGAVRVDFRVDKEGVPWILEINANPCLSSDAGFMAAAAQTGLSPQDVVKRLIPNSVMEDKN